MAHSETTHTLSITKSLLAGSLRIPGSKSHTIRGLAIAGLAEGESVIKNPLRSSDTLSCLDAVSALGARVDTGLGDGAKWRITGCGGMMKPNAFAIDVGNSGTTLRLMTAIAALGKEQIRFDGDASTRTRLMEPLLSALQNLGARVTSTNGRCPLTVKGPITGGKTVVNGISSQFVSALLIALPLVSGASEIVVENLHERPYVEMTLSWLRRQGIVFENRGLDWFRVKGGQRYRAFDQDIPADFSSATFALCAAAITGSEILICGLDFSDSQGDKKVFDFLQKMGLGVRHSDQGVWVSGKGLTGAELDLNDTPDALPALAVVGCFARGRTVLKNVAQARLKECDRIKAMAGELTRMGAAIHERPDGLVIEQSPLAGAHVHGYHDHRIVMALAVAGLASAGETVVDTADSIAVTYPSFVADMKKLGAHIESKIGH